METPNINVHPVPIQYELYRNRMKIYIWCLHIHWTHMQGKLVSKTGPEFGSERFGWSD